MGRSRISTIISCKQLMYTEQEDWNKIVERLIKNILSDNFIYDKL